MNISTKTIRLAKRKVFRKICDTVSQQAFSIDPHQSAKLGEKALVANLFSCTAVISLGGNGGLWHVGSSSYITEIPDWNVMRQGSEKIANILPRGRVLLIPPASTMEALPQCIENIATFLSISRGVKREKIKALPVSRKMLARARSSIVHTIVRLNPGKTLEVVFVTDGGPKWHDNIISWETYDLNLNQRFGRHVIS
jgi:hypothetical protein